MNLVTEKQYKNEISKLWLLIETLQAPKTCDGCLHKDTINEDDKPCEWCRRDKRNKFCDYYQPKALTNE